MSGDYGPAPLVLVVLLSPTMLRVEWWPAALVLRVPPAAVPLRSSTTAIVQLGLHDHRLCFALDLGLWQR